MAMQQLTLPGEIVKKHNEVVRSKINIASVQGGRILASLIASIRTDEKDFKDPYSLDLRGFLHNDSGKSYTEIRAVCRDLAKAFAEFEYTTPDGEMVLVETPFFARLIYSKGTVEALFNPAMRSSLLALQGHFTQYNLMEYLKLPSTYSQRIFEVLKSWRGKNEVTLPLDGLHDTLNTPPSFRSNFKEFRRWVLEKAHKDIRKHTSFFYEWEPVKRGRAVVGIRFVFSIKQALPVAKQKENDAIEKQSQKNNAAFLAATDCLKDRGPACEGGHQTTSLCELCRKLR